MRHLNGLIKYLQDQSDSHLVTKALFMGILMDLDKPIQDLNINSRLQDKEPLWVFCCQSALRKKRPNGSTLTLVVDGIVEVVICGKENLNIIMYIAEI